MSVYDRPVVGIYRERLTGDTSCGAIFTNFTRVSDLGDVRRYF